MSKRNVYKHSGYYSVSLANITDYLDVDALWSPRPGISSLLGKFRMSGDFLLRHALGDSSFTEEINGKRRESVYTDVIFRIPKTDYKDILRKQKRQWLQRELEERHNEAFKGQLMGDRPSQYLILQDDHLEPGTARFFFGDHVFVPGEDDRLLYRLSLECNNKVFNLEWQDPALPDPLPAGIYQRQSQGFQFGMKAGPYDLTDYFDIDRQMPCIEIIPTLDSGNQDRFMVCRNTPGKDDPYVDMGDEDGSEVRLILMEEMVDAEKPGESAPEVTLTFRRQECKTPVSALESDTEPDLPGTGGVTDQGLPPDDAYEIEAPMIEKDNTFMHRPARSREPEPDGTFRSSRGQHHDSSIRQSTKVRDTPKLKITGFFLRRLDYSRLYLEENDLDAVAWRIRFDENAVPVDRVQDAALTLSTDNKAPVLYIKEGNGDTVKLKMQDPYNGIFRILPPLAELDKEYLALVDIPNKNKLFHLEKGTPVVCGRAPGNTEKASFPLNLMNISECLKLSNDTWIGNFDRLTTSSDHIEVELTRDNQLRVRQLSRSVAVYILDEDDKIIKEMVPLPRQEYAPLPDEAERSAVLENGQQMIVGAYLLRFEHPVPGKKADKTAASQSSKANSPDEKQPESIIFEPVFNQFTELFYRFLKDRGVLSEKNELNDAVFQVVDWLKDKRDNPELTAACHAVRHARNRWIHRKANTRISDMALENSLTLARCLETLKKELFDKKFMNAQGSRVSFLEKEILAIKENVLQKG